MYLDSILPKDCDAAACWPVDTLWLILAAGETTHGQYSLLEELCPKDSGPLAHTHTQLKAFCILEGEITFAVDGRIFKAMAASYAAIPTVAPCRCSSASSQQSADEDGAVATKAALSEAGVRPVDKPNALRGETDPCMHL